MLCRKEKEKENKSYLNEVHLLLQCVHIYGRIIYIYTKI